MIKSLWSETTSELFLFLVNQGLLTMSKAKMRIAGFGYNKSPLVY